MDEAWSEYLNQGQTLQGTQHVDVGVFCPRAHQHEAELKLCFPTDPQLNLCRNLVEIFKVLKKKELKSVTFDVRTKLEKKKNHRSKTYVESG